METSTDPRRCRTCCALAVVLYDGECALCRFPPDRDTWKPRPISDQDVVDDHARRLRERETGRNYE